MVLQIIGAGFGRTGTHSLKLALELLNFGPCHHMYEVRSSAYQIETWRAIVDGAVPDWDAVFDGFTSQVDWPAAHYWKQLFESYPSAKVILTTRDPEEWYKSIIRTILPATLIGRKSDPDPNGRAASQIIYDIVCKDIFDGRLEEKAYALNVFSRHQKLVEETVPAKNLLVFDVRDGWTPLCNFLNREQPDVPFPRGNSTQEFLSRKVFL